MFDPNKLQATRVSASAKRSLQKWALEVLDKEKNKHYDALKNATINISQKFYFVDDHTDVQYQYAKCHFEWKKLQVLGYTLYCKSFKASSVLLIGRGGG